MKTKKMVCQDHGEFISQNYLGTLWSKCPECIDENDKFLQTLEKVKEVSKGKERINKANIPARFKECTLQNYIISSEEQRDAVKKCDNFASNPKSFLILCGSVGTGKTHLSIGIIKQSIYRALYATLQDIVLDVRSSWSGEGSELSKIKKYCEVPLLVVDEIGLQKGTAGEEIILFNILNGRYNNLLPTVLITNLSPKELNELWDKRLMDRIAEEREIIQLSHESYRRSKHE